MLGKRQLTAAVLSAAIVMGAAASAAAAGEITGNGRLKPVNGNSPCAYSGQEDLQWFTDDSDTTPLENPASSAIASRLAPAYPRAKNTRRAAARTSSRFRATCSARRSLDTITLDMNTIQMSTLSKWCQHAITCTSLEE